MADFFASVMTNAGAALLADALAGTAKIEFTYLAAGDGEYSEEERSTENLQIRTALKAQKQTVGFSSITKETETTVKLSAALDNEALESGYYVREIGLYAQDSLAATPTPILYSIAVARIADYLPPYNGYSPTTIIENYHVAIDNSANVTIESGSGAYALAEDLEAAEERIENLSEALEEEADKRQGFVGKTTVFNTDGSITETDDEGNVTTTVFNADGSITETLRDSNDTLIATKTTTFNADGSIVETVTRS